MYNPPKDLKRVHVSEIEKFFERFDFNLCNELKLNSWTKILNLNLCVKVGIATLYANSGDKRYTARYEQLLQVYYACKTIKESDYKEETINQTFF